MRTPIKYPAEPYVTPYFADVDVKAFMRAGKPAPPAPVKPAPVTDVSKIIRMGDIAEAGAKYTTTPTGMMLAYPEAGPMAVTAPAELQPIPVSARIAERALPPAVKFVAPMAVQEEVSVVAPLLAMRERVKKFLLKTYNKT